MPHRGRVRRAVLVALASALGTWSCTTTAPDTSSIPSAPADLAGRITSLVPNGTYAGTIRVEADPASTTSGAKGVVALTTTTNIWTIDRKAGDVRSLATGHWVRVWFNGPVALSYPVQGTAATVVVDSLGTGVIK